MLVHILALAFTVVFTHVECNPIWHNVSTAEADSALEALAKEICMKELGCFSITDDFKSLRYRPINVLPNDRVIINTKFLLYTKKNAKESHQLVASDKKSFDKSNFDAKDPVVFIVHGFMDSDKTGPWMQRMKDEFLLSGTYNVFVIDWSGGNKPPYYQATANTRVVGAEIDLMIQTLEKNKGIKRKDCHVIGHSLGAHIAGYAGARLKTLGRITGLDPAEPYFQNMPKSVRLDRSDADFVDAIHTDATDSMFIGLGMTQKVGHVDFYPNNGRNQPGCKAEKFTKFITDGLIEGGRRFAACNHQRSVDFMHESINYQKVAPVGIECADWESFLAGKCTECGSDMKKCAIMGIRAIEYKPLKSSTVQRAMYLQTGAKSPYWLYHYQITIKLYKAKAAKDVKGTIEVTLYGSNADELAQVQKSGEDLKHGTSYKYLVTTGKDLGEIKSVSMKWYSSSKNPLELIRKPSLYVESISVVPMNVIEKSPRSMTDRRFCDKPNNGISPRTVANFNKSKSCK